MTGDFGKIDYLGGETADPTASDIFAVEGHTWRQSFLVANESSWGDIPGEGFLGLAFSTHSVGGANTVVETLMSQLDQPRFGIYLGKHDAGSNSSERGLLTIGGSKEADYVGSEMVRIPIVKSQGQYNVWRSNIQSLSVSTQGANGTSTEEDTFQQHK